MMAELGQKIRTLRKEKGLTLDKLAELSSTSKSYLWELENKDCKRPSADKVSKIANALGVTIEYFFSASLEEAIDKAFYKEYLKLSHAEKKRFREIANLLV